MSRIRTTLPALAKATKLLMLASYCDGCSETLLAQSMEESMAPKHIHIHYNIMAMRIHYQWGPLAQNMEESMTTNLYMAMRTGTTVLSC